MVCEYRGQVGKLGQRFHPFHVIVKTHHPLDKMAAILADNTFKWIFLNENGRILI